MIETIWESEAISPVNGEPFFKVKRTDNWYVFGERNGIDSLAFVLYDRRTNMFGLINETKPPLGTDVFRTTAFGGSIDKQLSIQDICKEEVREEAGYVVTDKEVSYLGKVLVSTQMNQHCHLYFVDVTGLEAGPRELQTGEEKSTVRWLSLENTLELEDWKAPTIIVKSQILNLL